MINFLTRHIELPTWFVLVLALGAFSSLMACERTETFQIGGSGDVVLEESNHSPAHRTLSVD